MKRLIAIGFIWLGCAIAWVVLGSALVVRSGEASWEITREVEKLWGPPMEQLPPRVVGHVGAPPGGRQAATKDGRDDGSQQIAQPASNERGPSENGPPADGAPDNGSSGGAQSKGAVFQAPKTSLDASDIAVRLGLTHRQKGLLWFSTYEVDFAAKYTFANSGDHEEAVLLEFPLHRGEVVYDGFAVTDEAGQALDVTVTDGMARWTVNLSPSEARTFGVKYRSRGTSRWHYALTAGTGKVKQFRLTLDTDFEDIDFLPGSLSPSQRTAQEGGFHGEWQFESLIASSSIGLELPQKTNPGPLATRITFFAPVGLLFFFFVVAIFAAAQKREIHPLNYLFFGCAFFAYHLLFSYLVDHLAIAPSLAIASVVSVLLVVTYARLFVGWKFALREMGVAQALYLVLFSVTFLWKGFTGLSITVGAILSLFVMMQVTGRARWQVALAGGAGSRGSGPAHKAPQERAHHVVDGPAAPDQDG